MNTMESFKSLDKSQLIQSHGQQLLKDIQSNNIAEDPSLLHRFLLLVYADLKKYRLWYWMCFPALVFDLNITMDDTRQLKDIFDDTQVTFCHE